MKRIEYPGAVQTLIVELKRMPGIGPRSAERIALWMIQSRDARPTDIAHAISTASQAIRPCTKCGFFSDESLCRICLDPARDAGELCVVEQATDILPLERTGAFRGLYHTLGGRISPLDHVAPEDLRIESLLERVKADKPREIILALAGDVEGEATAHYIANLLREMPVNLTRLAQGIPAGSGLEQTDELTLSRAIAGRTKL